MNADKPQKSILPAGAEEAVKKMIDVVLAVKELAEKEAGILREQNTAAMKQLIAEKDALSKIYEKAGQEFQERGEEFRSVARALLLELKAEQEHVQDLTRRNTAYYEAARAKKTGKKQ